MISAHRCGAGADVALENTKLALEQALELDVQYIEFDVQRLGDGHFVLFHDDHLVQEGVTYPLSEMSFEQFSARADHFLDYEGVLEALAGKKKAHIDFKFSTPSDSTQPAGESDEVRATQLALDILGVDNIIITTLEDQSVRIVRQWARTRYPDLLVGLSLGRDLTGYGPWKSVRMRLSELFPSRRYARCGANLVVVNKALARATVARWAAKRGLPMLVWTVDTPDELEYWLQGRAWLVTTNYPERALTIVNQRSSLHG